MRAFFFTCLLLLSAALPAHAEDILSLKYAQGFRVEALDDGCRLVTVTPQWEGADETYRYLLVPRGQTAPEDHPEAMVIEVPARRLISLSTTHLAYLDAAGLTDRLVGLGSLEYVNTASVRKRIGAGELAEVGYFTNLKIETAMDLTPDLVLASASGSSYDVHPKLLEAGLPVVLVLDHLEAHPLARCEWIKFISLFFGTETHAAALFDDIGARYQALVRKTTALDHRPAVLTGAPFQGQWWVPRGESFMARLIADAGGDFLWRATEGTGSLPLDVESVYERAFSADIWINTTTWKRLADAPASDPRLADIPALKNGRVYNNNRRLNASGGNDFWESGILHPDLVLADLIAIFNPDLLPDHELVYYQRIE